MEDISKYIKYNWEIRYSVYVDDLILFSPEFGRSNIDKRTYTQESNGIITGDVNGVKGYLKIESASEFFNTDIEQMTKSDIINYIKELVHV